MTKFTGEQKGYIRRREKWSVEFVGQGTITINQGASRDADE